MKEKQEEMLMNTFITKKENINQYGGFMIVKRVKLLDPFHIAAAFAGIDANFVALVNK